ncbi:hypothetical protein ACL1HT_05045 [Corynebacterium striatum]|uniref:hypothetical protein n=1 Tax=Corynebacterium striatum TaxID=43770 RepID=UPI001A21873A|nr:hypothetical protein [Corynebacterium striatum]HAT6581171.1 hypothetical protein [Corynebacterium striatum]
MEKKKDETAARQQCWTYFIDNCRPLSKRETAKDNAIFIPDTPGANISLTDHDFSPVDGFMPGVSSNSGHKKTEPQPGRLGLA